MEKNDINKSEVFEFASIIEYAKSSIVSKTIIKLPTGNVSLFAFDKGEELSEHVAPFDALVQVIDGKAEIIINKIPYHLVAGQSIIMPANIVHALKAIEKFKMILTMIKQ
ncbi:MAG: cupin domain-containing protein [Bacteroidales bacterium]|jgi:quercetin dioxygenase-like cupin family protein|nr:cupin domain-containing protein [Bacteroidales bacterium]